MFIQFGADILLGAVILLVGFWLANLVAKVIGRGEYNSSRWLANLVRILIMGLVVAMGLRAMGIADSIVNLAFGLTLGAVAVAFALAFGLGGRQPAERLLLDLMDKAKKQACKPNPLHDASVQEEHIAPLTEQVDSSVVADEYQRADVPPTQADVDPAQKPLNKPFGSTGEAEADIDLHPKDDPK